MKLDLDQPKDSFQKSASETSKSLTCKINNSAMVIDILRNRLYAKPLQTMVQEYLCNARDAHREANQTQRRIQVTLPEASDNEIVLKIRDYGLGMSPERIADVFVNFGDSTKRGSDNETGGFGIGGKSAWAYSETFGITSFHGGMKRVYIAHIGESKCGQLDPVSESPSAEPSGVEVTIPIQKKDLSAVEQAAHRTCFLWSPDEYPEGLAYDQPVPRLEIDNTIGFLINDQRLLDTLNGKEETTNNYYGRSDTVNYLVVDGIPYAIPKELLSTKHGHRYNAAFFLRAKTGAVDVNASRESIAVTDKTKAFLNEAYDKGHAALIAFLRENYGRTDLSFDEHFEQHSVYNKSIQGHTASFKVNKRKFTVEQYGKLSFEGIESLDYRLYSYKSRASRASLEKHSHRFEGSLKEKSFYNLKVYYTDQVTSMKAELDRASKLLYKDSDSLIVLMPKATELTDAGFLSIMHDLGAKPLSSIQLPESEKSKRVKLIKNETTIHATELKKGQRGFLYYPIAIDLAKKFEKPFVYAAKETPKLDELRPLLEDFTKEGIKVVLLSEIAIKRVQENAAFVSFSAFCAAPVKTLGDKRMTEIKNRALINEMPETLIGICKKLSPTETHLKNAKLNGLCIFIHENRALLNEGLSHGILNLVKCGAFKDRKKEIEKIKEAFPLCYPIIGYNYGDKDTLYYKHLVAYINSQPFSLETEKKK